MSLKLRSTFATALATLLLVSAASGASAAESAKSSDQAHKALGTLNRVVDHTQRLMTAKNYDRLPHENGEFIEGSEALLASIAAEPAAFKTKVQMLVKKAESDSQNLADAAKAHDDSRIAAAHAALADSVKEVQAAFPES